MESTGITSPMFAFVGCFTTKERNARGKGISVYRIDQSTGAWTSVQVLETIPNPQFISFDREQKFLYSAHGDGTEIGAYAIDRQTGKLEFLNQQPTGGKNAPHLVPDPTNRYVVLANGPGVAVFPINKDGSLAPHSDVVVPPGEPGPHRKGQNGPHPHHVLFDPVGWESTQGETPRFFTLDTNGNLLYAANLNSDSIVVFRVDRKSGKLTPTGQIVETGSPSRILFARH